ncbi:family S53 protease [Amylocystis lapponica]|nr:family S53 protease [Amylocystis lapponica]
MVSAAHILTVSLFTLGMGKPVAQHNMLVHEAREVVPTGFTLAGSAPSDSTLNMRIALVQNNIDGLIDVLHDVSDPTSPNYGKHLTKAEVETYTSPKPDSVAAVNSWLDENGITATTISPAGDWLAFTVDVSTANTLFDANYSVFSYGQAGEQTIRTLTYSIPADLEGHIDVVHPTITFPNPYTKPVPNASLKSVVLRASTTNSSNPCGSDILNPKVVPACLQSAYDIPVTPATAPSNRIAIAGYDNEYANAADLEIFLKQYRPDMNSSTTFTLATLDGGLNSQNGSEAGQEAALDIQYTIGVATDVPAEFISVGPNYQDNLYGYLDIINYLLEQDSPPQVLTTSYSSNEEQFSSSLASKLCNAYAQLGARGVTIIFSSGDGGVSGTSYSNCKTFVPTFPNSCPYVTSVGGTAELEPQVAIPSSGGGFSNYFARPAFQDAAVSAYFSSQGKANDGLYNASGRGFPDVSALATGFKTVWNGTDYPYPLSGTSCSAPTFASVVALLNDRLIASGRPPLGWINPWLYSTGASAMTDIVTGNNNACCTDSSCAVQTGFNATVGWDPVTGLGTPNFTRMAAALGL